MLSYQHGYHAGGHADVLKHTVLTALLARLVAKDKPLRYIETHAGAGSYDLRSATARKNREHDTGVGKLWGARDAPSAVARTSARCSAGCISYKNSLSIGRSDSRASHGEPG